MKDYNKTVSSTSIFIVDNTDYEYEENKSTTYESEISKGLIICHSNPLPAFSWEQLNISEFIFDGIVLNITSSMYLELDNELIIYRDINIKVVQALKGETSEIIRLRRVGGTILEENTNYIQLISSQPHYNIGEKVRLYVNKINSKSETIYMTNEYGKWVQDYSGQFINMELVNSRIVNRTS